MLADDDDVGLHVLGCRVDILGTVLARFGSPLIPWHIHRLEAVIPMGETGLEGGENGRDCA